MERLGRMALRFVVKVLRQEFGVSSLVIRPISDVIENVQEDIAGQPETKRVEVENEEYVI
jgi:hypothetical protein